VSTIELSLEWRGKKYKNVEAGFEAFGADIERGVERASPVIRQELELYLKAVGLAMQKRHSEPWHPGVRAHELGLFKRSGALVKAIRDSVQVSGDKLDDIEGRIGASLIYARIQEYGGTIAPVATKYLAIPLPSAMDNRGIPLKKSPREWDNTFVAKSKAGNLLIFQKRVGKIIPLYVLKSKVTIPPRLGLGDTLRTGADAFTDRVMNRMLKAILDATV